MWCLALAFVVAMVCLYLSSKDLDGVGPHPRPHAFDRRGGFRGNEWRG